jgi:hypothetical protein
MAGISDISYSKLLEMILQSSELRISQNKVEEMALVKEIIGV